MIKFGFVVNVTSLYKSMIKLREKYNKEILPELAKRLHISNPMAVPRLVKIVVNCGLGEALSDKKVIESMSTQLAIITGQKPQVTRARRAISTFKLRAGDAIGLKVTLRGGRMYDFLMKLIAISLPRVRDFRGISQNGFDGQGNYTFGIAEQTIFPELEYKLMDKIRGFEITFVTTAHDTIAAKTLLELLGLPFAKEK
jgi:large subunit ribosomal protein L5